MMWPAIAHRLWNFSAVCLNAPFMRKKLEAIRRELRETGTVDDQRAYAALLERRSMVTARYQAAFDWLTMAGRTEEAKRFELMQQRLPAVRTEKQLIVDELMAQQRGRAR